MFAGFEKRADREAQRRFAVSAGASFVAYAGIGAAAVFAAGVVKPALQEKKIEVVFRPLPEVVRSATPPPAIPEGVKVRKVAALKLPTALVEPEKIPDQKHAEADPSNDTVDVGEGGSEGGVGPGGVMAPEAPALPAPPVKKHHVDPINLPEEATPPVADDGNVTPDYPEEARAKGLEGQVILKIVVTEGGAVGRIEVLRGEEPFLAVALAAVRSWRYSPALVDGQAAAVFRIVKLPFRLKA